jgi:hypothetical protein
MQLPFVLSTHYWLRMTNPNQATGFGQTYENAIIFSGIFWVLLGLIFLYRTLSEKYRPFTSLIVCICLFLGTNLLYYSSVEAGMSHAYSFGLFGFLIYLIPKFYNHTNWKNTLLIAITLSFIIFIRPLNALVLIYMILFDVNSTQQFIQRVQFIFRNWLKYLIFAVPLGILLYIQIQLWTHMRGFQVIDSYPGEGFIHVLNPYFFSVLFNIQNGFFVFAPVMFLSLIGLFYPKSTSNNFKAIGTTFIILTFMLGSWWAWWFGGAYGHRCFVEYLVLLAFPLANFLQYTFYSSRLHNVTRALLVLLTCVFLHYSLGMTQKYLSPWDGPDWTFTKYWNIVQSVF